MRRRHKRHAEDRLRSGRLTKNLLRLLPPPKDLRAARKSKEGRAALRRHKNFYRVPYPPEVKLLKGYGRKGKTKWMVGLGRSPFMHLSSGAKKRTGKRWKVNGKFRVVTDAKGRRLYVISGRPPKGKFKFVGYAPETWYIPPKKVELAGSPKRGKWWRHLHHDAGGKWPKVLADRNGKMDSKSNFFYAPSTYRVTDWIRR